jgi:hypothetical protein
MMKSRSTTVGIVLSRLVAVVFALLGLGGMAISVVLSPANFFAAANCCLLAILVDLVGLIAQSRCWQPDGPENR